MIAASVKKFVDPLKAFEARCDARAYLFAVGDLDLLDVPDFHAEADAPPCDICGCARCASWTFCKTCRAVDRKAAAQHQTREPHQQCAASQATYDAILYELRTYGISQLAKPNCRRRLFDLSTEQVRELIAALMRLRPRYPAITDDLLLKLGDQL